MSLFLKKNHLIVVKIEDSNDKGTMHCPFFDSPMIMDEVIIFN
jgi:hypothetical protein